MTFDVSILSEFKAQISDGNTTLVCHSEQVWECFLNLYSAFGETPNFSKTYRALGADTQFLLVCEIYNLVDDIFRNESHQEFGDFASACFGFWEIVSDEQDSQDELNNQLAILFDDWQNYLVIQPTLKQFLAEFNFHLTFNLEQ